MVSPFSIVTHLILTSAACAITSFVLTAAARRVGLRYGFIDVPNERSSHEIPTPRTGGMAIVAATLGFFVVSRLTDLDRTSAWLIMMSMTIAIMGGIDDIAHLRASTRFLFQNAAALTFLIGAATALHEIEVPFLGIVRFGVLAIPFTMIWMVAVTNIFNFMDGIDGIAGGEAVVCGVGFTILFLGCGDWNGALLAALIAAAVAGFLPFNVPRASIFMGDVGSATIGFLLAGLVVRLANDRVPLLAAVLPLMPFLLDASATMVRRACRRENLLRAHRSHYYQRLVRSGFSHATVTSIWAALAVVASLAAFAYIAGNDASRLGLLAGVLALHVIVAIETDARNPMCAARS